MSIEVKVPILPESVADAMIATWHKKVGDSVRRDENLVDLETDKVVLEVPSPVDGVLTAIEQDTGAIVQSDELLARIEEGEISAEKEQAPAAESTPLPAAPEKNTSAPESAALSPSVRRIVSENQLNSSDITASGRGGRITKADALQHIEHHVTAGSRKVERVKMTRLRSRIAERMIESQQRAALLTSFNEVDLNAVMNIRKQYKEAFEKQHGVKLGLMSFFVKAVCEALNKFPIVNSSVDGDDILYHNFCDVGIAVSTDRGLLVPILRDAERMSLSDIEQQIREYAVSARKGTLDLKALQGGTFTITNGGVFGSLLSTPIVNPPQSAIFGMHTIKERAVVVDGNIVARPMMFIAITYDHRIIDGKDAVQFLVAVKDALEDPTRMLLGL